MVAVQRPLVMFRKAKQLAELFKRNFQVTVMVNTPEDSFHLAVTNCFSVLALDEVA
jgi:hypothetical protein